MIMTNGTSPGPALKIKQGDCVEFLVHNELPDPTSVHFHGIVQQNTAWSDGVPGLTQEPIKSGSSFLYKWTADASGVYFYHAHYRAQIMDGCYGAIIVSPAEDAEQPFKLISNDTEKVKQMKAAEAALETIFVSDYSRFTSAEFYNMQADANVDITCADAIILNGKGSQHCLSRGELTAYTSPKVQALLASVNPPQLSNKGCLPPNLVATQGNFTRNIAALPPTAYDVCTPSSGEMETITVDATKGYAALTFVNPGGYEILKFTIDGHKMWVYAVDGGYVTPQLVDQIIINNGDRYSVLVPLNQAPAQYSIRVTNQGLNQVISGFGVLSYKGSSGPANANPNALSGMNFAGVNLTQLVPFSDPKAAPFPPNAPPAKADVTYTFNIKKTTKAFEWTLSGVNAFNMTNEDELPYLDLDPASIPTSDLVLKTTMGQVVDLIVKVQGPLAQPHPMHKHSNKAYVLGKGLGAFNWSTVAEAAAVLPPNTFNFVNPPLRDGYTTTPAEGNSSWLALRYEVVNPGPFLFHCHVQTHMSGGMAITLLDGVDQWPQLPAEYADAGNGLISSELQKKGKTHPVS
jgi:FtsP/CotA-like multicopper oxidase with cupredoxin domain